MHIYRMKTNHITNPLGFYMEKPIFSWSARETLSKKQISARVEVAADAGFSCILFDSGFSDGISSLAFTPDIALTPRTRYFWRVTVNGDAGDSAVSDTAWFETSKMDEPWGAKWIVPEWEDNAVHPYMRKVFTLSGEIASARVYASGIGLYQMEINGKKAGSEYLAPHFNAYYQWLQYQTYDITDCLTQGENTVGAMLGNGWVKGRFGFRGEDPVYGGPFTLIAEIRVTYKDGTTSVIYTDESWKCVPSAIKDSSIYDGETCDARSKIPGWSAPGLNVGSWSAVREQPNDMGKLTARLSLPVVVKETIKPRELIVTPAGETVIDMGQNMVGWVRFKADAPEGQKLSVYHCEILQENNFYTENLRSAKQEYHYISDGKPATVEPVFTFFGFRYIKLVGWSTLPDINDFEGCVLYSDMELTGNIETSNPLVNRLFLNALWGQKGNFLDLPTDCPQRDERMGWTGDAQVFSGTASFNMDCYTFYSKFLHDMYMEQLIADGCVPNIVPSNGMGKPSVGGGGMPAGGACAWADAAAVIPWNTYLFSGDRDILERQYKSMKAWVDWVASEGVDVPGSGGWLGRFHFGDWLALDGPDINSVKGGTEDAFLAAAYYVYSTRLTAKAAAVLGYEGDAKKYGDISDNIREDIRREYFSEGGRGTLQNQTYFAVSLFMDLVPEKHRGKFFSAFERVLEKDNYHLKTGFVGTPILCRVLSAGGRSDLAYKLLLHEDLPSWLYAVNMGATTIWERWNSVNPDGTISSSGMNSLNHYSYGAIVEWMYRNMCGLNPIEDAPGFKKAVIAPEINGSFSYVKAEAETAAGLYKSGWALGEDGAVTIDVEVPFDAEAEIVLPRAEMGAIEGVGVQEECAEGVRTKLRAGSYCIKYTPSVTFLPHLDFDTPIAEIIKSEAGRSVLLKHIPMLGEEQAQRYVRNGTINSLLKNPMSASRFTEIDLIVLEKELAKAKM